MSDSTSSHCILVTGGAGYIGSHFIESLLRESSLPNVQCVIVDDLSTGHSEFILKLNEVAQQMGRALPVLEKVDLLEKEKLQSVFRKHQPQVVLHFAAKISVAESVAKPDYYHQNNVVGSQNLLSAMKESGCKKMVFSSTAAVYGAVSSADPLAEDAPLAPVNPYGKTKLTMEEEIRKAGKEWGLQSVIFRYFNAAGASQTCDIGEWHEPETHLIPLLIESVATGQKPLQVFGNDYPTRDGTCVRDYIHVSDLAWAHLLGLKRLIQDQVNGSENINLGTETGTSVLEMVAAATKTLHQEVKYQLSPRRPGDSATLVASNQKAQKVLGWTPKSSHIELILQSAWKWHQKHGK